MTSILGTVARLRRTLLAFILTFVAAAAHAQITVTLDANAFSGGVVAQGENVQVEVTISNSSGLSFSNITFNINSTPNVQLIGGFSGGTCTPPPTVLNATPQRLNVTVPALGPNASCRFFIDSTMLSTGTANLDAPAGGQVTAGGFENFFITGLPALQVNNTDTGDVNSLDTVIRYLNSHCTGSDVVTFAIPGAGPHTIQAGGPLPPITCAGATLDGYTQPGSVPASNVGTAGTNAVLQVVINGQSCSCGNGLTIQLASNVTVKGLAIHSFFNHGIFLGNAPNAIISGNFFGTDAGGTVRLPNALSGVSGTATGALIGGPGPEARNLISGSGGPGTSIGGNNVTWQNNAIGLDRNGIAGPLVNANEGVYITNGTGHQVVGNVIAGNVIAGVHVLAAARANIGNNVIAQNNGAGILVRGTSNTLINNTLHANTGPGIDLQANDNFVQGGRSYGNGGDGIIISGDGNEVRQVQVDTNTGAGIRVASGNDNHLTLNVIFGNTVRGIVHGGAGGGTPNDETAPPYDTDSGPNGLMNHPVITSVQTIGSSATFIAGTLKTVPNSPFQIELYGNSGPRTLGDGEVLLGTVTGETNGDGFFPFTFNYSGLADNVSAIVTVDRCGDGCTETSEFSFPTVVAVPSAGPALSASPSTLTFMPQPVGTFSPTQTSTVTNAGPGTVTISSITSSGDFQFTTDCGSVLSQGASCFLDAQFHPLVVGPRTGAIRIVSDAAASPLNVSLSGTGTPGPQAAISLSPDALVFEAVELGERSGRQAIRVANTGTGELTLRGFDTTGDFTILRPEFRGDSFAGSKRGGKASRIVSDPPYTTCFDYLFPGDSCVIVIEFEPTARGPRTGLLIVDSDAPASPSVSARLSGQGGTGPTNQLEVPTVLEFSAQFFGARSEGQDLRIRNLTDQTVTLIDVVLEGADFTAGQTCTTIAPRATCAITVFFKPTQLGLRSGSITLRNQTEGATYRAELRGLGIANPTPLLRLSVSAIGLGTATGPRSALVRVFNEGQQPIQFNLVSATGDFMAVSRCGTTLAVGQACDIDVTFFAALTGPRNGILRVDSNAAGSPHQVELSAVGCRAPSAAFSRTRSLLCGPGN